MRKWCKALIFIVPLLCMVAAVNWYVDSYACLRVTYDQIGEQMAVNSMNVAVWRSRVSMTGICCWPA